MKMSSRISSLGTAAAVFAFLTTLSLAQQPQAQPGAFPDTKQVLGLDGIKQNASGTLTIGKGTLDFTSGKKKAEIQAASIRDVVTDKDSQRTIGGVVGTMSMFAPYGGGRFLSLFRTKIDTLTIEYQDASGGLHGAVFTMPAGRAQDVKKDLLAEGAHTTIPTEVASPLRGKEPMTKTRIACLLLLRSDSHCAPLSTAEQGDCERQAGVQDQRFTQFKSSWSTPRR